MVCMRGIHAHNSSKAALLGLDHIIPVLTPELLAAPSLGTSLFSLLAYLAELFPDHVAGMPAPSFQRLVALLEYGLQHPEQEVLQQCLEAVAALAGWHVTVSGGGAMPDAGLGGHNAPGAGLLLLTVWWYGMCKLAVLPLLLLTGV